MCRLLWIVPVLVMLSGCQTPPEKAPPVSGSGKAPKKAYLYRFEGSSRTAGFNFLINGTELAVVEGGRDKNFTAQADLNDWMMSGNNELAVSIFWPEAVKFVPGTAQASFRLFVNDELVREFRWPAGDVPDEEASYPHTINESFRAEGFPKVMTERAERVISFAGVLPRGDQEEIAAIMEELRNAFAEGDFKKIDELFRIKYADLAAARFTTAAAIRTAMNETYRELMEKDSYAVRPLYGRYGYLSIADDRLVRLIQGRVGFPEPALVITYKDGRRTLRHDLELYFAKIDGRWVIIR